jgi:hypothetical protein
MAFFLRSINLIFIIDTLFCLLVKNIFLYCKFSFTFALQFDYKSVITHISIFYNKT